MSCENYIEFLLGFIIGRHNLNKLRYAEENVDSKHLNETEGNPRESEKRQLTINCKMKECMVIS